MELKINPEPPEILHIDLNSAFAMTEQQANPLLRGRPVGVTNRLNDYAICIAASYEAKALGIGLGTRNKQARIIAPNFVMLETDPAKYKYIHNKLRVIFESYSPVAYMKSIDEGIIDFRGMRGILGGKTMEDIALEIKERIKREVGDYMSVNVGIGQNRWLAKLAASFMKPDGLYQIDKDNLEVVYSCLDLMDLPYIASRMKLRLIEQKIFTPLDFYRAPEVVLKKQVFKSINGHHWYLKLRGYETETQTSIHTVGRSYVLEHRTQDPVQIAAILYKTSVKIARRLARNNLAARGIILQLGYTDYPYRWQQRKMYALATRRGEQIYKRALELIEDAPKDTTVSAIAMTSYALEPYTNEQIPLYDDETARRERIEDAVNSINDIYGEMAIVPAGVMISKNPMADKISFGSIRYFN
jgi:DNA polymerase-4